MERSPKIGTVEITSEIIEHLIDHGPAGVAETARTLDQPKSTVHDHLQSLATQGYVVDDGGTYRPSMRFLAVGEQTRNDLSVYRAAREPLQALAGGVDLHVSLAIEEHGRIVLIDTVPGDDPSLSPRTVASRWRCTRHPRAKRSSRISRENESTKSSTVTALSR